MCHGAFKAQITNPIMTDFQQHVEFKKLSGFSQAEAHPEHENKIRRISPDIWLHTLSEIKCNLG